MGSYISYAVTEIYCIIFAIIMLARLNSNIGSEHEVFELRNMIYSFIAMLSSDIVWAFVMNGTFTPEIWSYRVVNAVWPLAMTLGCYFWCRFIEDRLHPRYALHRNIRILMCLPVLLICVLDVTSIFTGWMFYVAPNYNYDTGPLYGLQSIVDYFYLIIPTVVSLHAMFKARSKSQRTEYFTYAIYMAAPLIAGFIGNESPAVPALALNTFMVLLLLFLTIQNSQIYNDALTNLNNRRRLDQYLDDRLSEASEQRPVTLYMLDINQFKAINDTYGHIEGDNALKLLARVLRKVAGDCNAFIARYGGDEFCLVTHTSEYAPDEMELIITQALLDAQENAPEKMPYTLTVSIGHATGDKPLRDITTFIHKADEMLYIRKHEWSAQHV